MRHRLLVTVVLLLALAVSALPANAGKPNQASVTTTITLAETCSFEVTYSWSGFSGTGLQAELVLGSHELGGLDLILAWTFIPGQAGSSGSVSATFTLSGPPSTHEFFGFGQLLKVAGNDPSRVSMVKNSYAESSALPPQTCGPNVTVS